MTWESGSSDQQRQRAGYAVLSLGIFILLCAWVLYAIRGPEGLGEVAAQHRKLEPPDPEQVWPAVSTEMLLYGCILIILLFVSLLAFLRISRSYRQHLLKKPSKPTSTTDVWKMHKVPDQPENDRQPGDTQPLEPPG